MVTSLLGGLKVCSIAVFFGDISIQRCPCTYVKIVFDVAKMNVME
jgi:hypothetical protein